LKSVLSARLALALVICLAAANAADPPKHPPALEAIVDLSAAAPPEFRAAALLRAVESGKVSDPGWKKELIADAFGSAVGAQIAAAKRIISQSPSTPLPPLDRLSLQTRAVLDMRQLDGLKAREMFLAIAKPAARKLACEDASIENLSSWWSAAAQMVSTFTPTERRNADHVAFAAGVIAQLASITEISDAQAMLTVPAWRQDEKDLLGAKFAAALEALPADNVALQLVGRETRVSIDALANSGYNADMLRGTWTRVAAAEDPDSHCAKVTPPVDPTTARLTARWISLMYGPKQQGLTDSQKATDEWRAELASYLDEIGSLEPGLAAEALGGLLLAVPPGTDRDRIRAQYVTAMADSPVLRHNPPRWMGAVRQLMDSSAASGEQARLLDAFESSGNPTLLLCARLERTLPEPGAMNRSAH
jgi:hypothetical protein